MKFKILCSAGDSEYDYPNKIAELKFDELKNAGMLPVVADGKVLKEFDPGIEELTWVPKVMGG